MPCRDSDYYTADTQRKLDALTQLLCKQLVHFESFPNYTPHLLPEMIVWWEAHKKLDAARLARENKEKREAQMLIELARIKEELRKKYEL